MNIEITEEEAIILSTWLLNNAAPETLRDILDEALINAYLEAQYEADPESFAEMPF